MPIRVAAVYSVYLALITIELVIAVSPGGSAYNTVGAVLAVALMVLRQ